MLGANPSARLRPKLPAQPAAAGLVPAYQRGGWGHLERHRIDDHAADGVKGTLDTDLTAAPQGLDDCEPLLKHRDALRRVDTERGELFRPVAQAKPYLQPPAADVIEHRDLLGQRAPGNGAGAV
ncbi:MAG: hypothetical protein KatS3mg059_0968 [Thermomicrobiales bacterium]|nr:MAG: hypothetical protein KatS3mg059_0968 [Thermomicrobiales bacterium]